MVRAHARMLERVQRKQRAGSMGRHAALGTAAVLSAAAIAAGTAEAADFPVSNLNNVGAGSLRAALISANAAAGADTVSFSTGVAGRIELNTALLVDDPVTVNGPGSGVVTVDGNENGSVFNINSLPAADQPVTISGLKITGGGGSLYGGGIYNAPGGGFAAELTVADSVLTGNRAIEFGGGIYSDEGSLTVRNSTISRNHVGDGSGDDYGGGIMVADTDGDQPIDVTITGSTLNNNSAYGDGGAAYFENVDNDVLIERSTIDGNTSQEDGGGLVFSAGAGTSNAVVIESSTFSNNTSLDLGGGVWFLDATQSQLVSNSTFTGNFAGFGGAIYDGSDENIPTIVRNSTLTGNEAVEDGGGIYNLENNPGDILTISSSIVSGNVAGTGNDLGDDGGGTFVAGFSLIGSTTGPTNPLVSAPAGSNLIGVDPQLGPLADNGGPTLTRLPALASPVIDAGVANGLTVDQRGLPRTANLGVANAAGGDGTDIGSVELADDEVSGTVVKAKKKQRQTGRNVKVKITASATEEVTVLAKGKVKVGKKSYPLQKFSRVNAADRTARITLNPKKGSASEKIQKALDKRKKVKASLKVTLTDNAGNTFVAKPKVTLK